MRAYISVKAFGKESEMTLKENGVSLYYVAGHFSYKNGSDDLTVFNDRRAGYQIWRVNSGEGRPESGRLMKK